MMDVTTTSRRRYDVTHAETQGEINLFPLAETKTLHHHQQQRWCDHSLRELTLIPTHSFFYLCFFRNAER